MQGAGAARQEQTAGAALSVEQAHGDKAEQHADYGEYGGVAPVVEGVRLRQHFAEGDVEHGPCGERERGGYDKRADAAHPDADDAAEQGGDAGERGEQYDLRRRMPPARRGTPMPIPSGILCMAISTARISPSRRCAPCRSRWRCRRAGCAARRRTA